MLKSSESEQRKFEHIFHPTDLSVSSEKAFHHALRIALGGDGNLAIFHAEKAASPENDLLAGYPSVGATIEKWQQGEQETRNDNLGRHKVNVAKLREMQQNTVESVATYAKSHPIDLVVLATHAREGLPRLFHGSTAETLKTLIKAPALFVPNAVNGFIDAETGSPSLSKILVPIAPHPYAQAAIEEINKLVETLALTDVTLELLYVGHDGEAPAVSQFTKLPTVVSNRHGSVVDTIVDVARNIEAELIAMTTKGHDGFLDALRGSTTEQVLRRAPCAVLAVPAR